MDSTQREGLLQILRSGIDAWNSGDLDAALEDIHPDIEWYTGGLFPDLEPVYRGHEGVRRFWAQFIEPWEEIRAEVVAVLLEEGDTDAGRVVTRTRFRATGRGGINVDLEIHQYFRSHEGKLIEFRVFRDQPEALEAATVG